MVPCTVPAYAGFLCRLACRCRMRWRVGRPAALPPRPAPALPPQCSWPFPSSSKAPSLISSEHEYSWMCSPSGGCRRGLTIFGVAVSGSARRAGHGPLGAACTARGAALASRLHAVRRALTPCLLRSPPLQRKCCLHLCHPPVRCGRHAAAVLHLLRQLLPPRGDRAHGVGWQAGRQASLSCCGSALHQPLAPSNVPAYAFPRGLQRLARPSPMPLLISFLSLTTTPHF